MKEPPVKYKDWYIIYNKISKFDQISFVRKEPIKTPIIIIKICTEMPTKAERF